MVIQMRTKILSFVMPRPVFIFVLLSLVASVIYPQTSEKRYALVIGNGKYSNISPLVNTIHDAIDVSASLKRLGFTVKTIQNGTKREMYSAIRNFGAELEAYDVGLFYFAGHGLQYEGQNYLVSVDSDIQRETDIPFETTDLNRILAEMEAAGTKVNIVILDACRNNPYAGRLRSMNRGLSVVKAPSGSLILYATAPGDAAVDGAGRNGTFTEALLKHMEKPGVDIEVLLKDVRKDVQDSTQGKQIPWTTSSLTSAFYFSPPVLFSPPKVSIRTGSLNILNFSNNITLTIDGVDVTRNVIFNKDKNLYVLQGVPAGSRIVSFEGPYIKKIVYSVDIKADESVLLANKLELIGRLNLKVNVAGEMHNSGVVLRLQNFDMNELYRFPLSKGILIDLPPGGYKYFLSYVDDHDIGYEGIMIIDEGSETKLNISLDYSNKYKMDLLTYRRDSLNKDLKEVKLQREKYQAFGGGSIVLSLLCAGAAGFCYLQGEKAMDLYDASSTTSEADRYKKITQAYSTGFTVSAISSGVLFMIGVLRLNSLPNPNPLKASIKTLDESIKKLNEGR